MKLYLQVVVCLVFHIVGCKVCFVMMVRHSRLVLVVEHIG
ncbi:hypothetical protein SLEP1_g47712 [Rubroshorea leprosula]|uniref:Uncharacterized protein n=1 Tax=Rubroshorea leprosula TaxID=152421 RepID=A0AAV5LRE1_9ROSI|nr:hypothetical protein SLEP1_g47712 [Rubroshorea leprosula]